MNNRKKARRELNKFKKMLAPSGLARAELKTVEDEAPVFYHSFCLLSYKLDAFINWAEAVYKGEVIYSRRRHKKYLASINALLFFISDICEDVYPNFLEFLRNLNRCMLFLNIKSLQPYKENNDNGN